MQSLGTIDDDPLLCLQDGYDCKLCSVHNLTGLWINWTANFLIGFCFCRYLRWLLPEGIVIRWTLLFKTSLFENVVQRCQYENHLVNIIKDHLKRWLEGYFWDIKIEPFISWGIWEFGI
jgi:hypothetical protein